MSLTASGIRAPLGVPVDVYRSEDGNYHIEADLHGVDAGGLEVVRSHASHGPKGRSRWDLRRRRLLITGDETEDKK
jgi:hypothetical protein